MCPVQKKRNEKKAANAQSKGQWMEFTVNGTADANKLTMKTDEHGIPAGLDPMEYLASSIQSCLQVMIVLVATEKEMTIGAVSWDTIISVDPKGSAGTPMTIVLCADIEVDEKDEAKRAKVQDVVEEAEARCPMSTMCKRVGINVVFNYGLNGDKGISLLKLIPLNTVFVDVDIQIC